MTRWEYQSIQLWPIPGQVIGSQQSARKEGKQAGLAPALAAFGPEWEALLNQLGDEGWELDQLASPQDGESHYVAIMRRQKPSA